MTGREVHQIMNLPIDTSWDDLNPAQRAMYEEIARDHPEIIPSRCLRTVRGTEKGTEKSRVISWPRAILEGLASIANPFAGRDR